MARNGYRATTTFARSIIFSWNKINQFFIAKNDKMLETRKLQYLNGMTYLCFRRWCSGCAAWHYRSRGRSYKNKKECVEK